MKHLIGANMELVSADQIKHIIKLDAPLVASDCDEFLKENQLGYYIAVNTFLLIVKTYSKYGYLRVKDYIFEHGLFHTIRVADKSASELIASKTISNSLFRSVYHDVNAPMVTWGFPTPEDNNIGVDPMATMLGILRYLKRFSPIGNDKICDESITDFLKMENRMKLLQRREPNAYIIKWVKDALHSLLDWEKLCDRIDQLLSDGMYLDFPTGVGADAASNLRSKLCAVMDALPEAYREPHNIPYTGNRVLNNGANERLRVVRVQAVPKSYKAARIIAMEKTVRQTIAGEIASIIDTFLPGNVPLHCQGVNQYLAFIGSYKGYLATIDLSHASDTISKVLFRTIYPTRFVNLIEPYLGNVTEINGTWRYMQQATTAGNSLTFILESITFAAIAKAAENFHCCFSNTLPVSMVLITEENLEDFQIEHYEPLRFEDTPYIPIPTAYGDDIVCHVSYVEELFEFLEGLGFIVNKDKSFFDGPYRESCGSEFYDGYDISSMYYPRFAIEGYMRQSHFELSRNIRRDSFNQVYSDSLCRIIDLQQRLYYVSYPASRFVFELVKMISPKVTTSVAGTPSTDLWEYENTFVLRKAPYSEIPSKPDALSDEEWEEAMSRKLKWLPKTDFVLDTKVSDRDRRRLDVYRYYHFLKYGPSFEDPLLELLGISMPPVSNKQACGKPVIKWGYREP